MEAPLKNADGDFIVEPGENCEKLNREVKKGEKEILKRKIL